ncbi:MAG: acyl-CoA/acyl-ACP dehydrogenase [Acidobacteriota bacterium]|nr:acyl-CoA/acyl-ACP dehydrogenase [Acidobacteriota bacterium]
MDFGLTQPQELLRDSIARFLAQDVGIERVRRVMDSESGRDEAIHGQLGDQGITGLLIDMDLGGSELGMQEAAIAAQEIGRAAAPVNFHSSYVLAPLLIAGGDGGERRNDLLEGIAEGRTLVTPILDAPIENGRVDGSVLYLPDAAWADAFLLEDSGSLHLLDATTPGIEVEALQTVDDTRRVAEVTFSSVDLGAAESLGGNADSTRRALYAAQIALAADALGAAQKGLHIAVEYAKERKQFDRIIGSFQAVKHICAEVLAEVEPVQSLLWHTADVWDEGSDEIENFAPLLKAHATDVANQAVTMTTQVFGGIGFTHECDMHIFYKRAGYDRQMLGNPTALREQVAAVMYG